MGQTMSRGAIQDLVSKFAVDNPKYRDALIKNPKAIVERQLNTQLPKEIKIKAAVETADTAYVVVPYIAKEGELSDADVEKVAGGKMDEYEADCDNARTYGAGANTVTVINL